MSQSVRRHRVAVVVLLAAAAAGAMWALIATPVRTPKAGNTVPSTADLLGRAGVVILTHQGPPVTFPDINVWEAPLLPVGWPRAEILGGIGHTRRRELRWQTVILQVTRKMYPRLQAAVGQKQAELWRSIRSAAKQANLKVPMSERASPIVAATWLAWATSGQRSGSQPTCLILGHVLGFDEPMRERRFEWWPELVVRNGMIWHEFKAIPPTRPTTLSDEWRPLHPTLGQTALLGGMDEMRFTARETVRVSGAIFRCWVLEGAWKEGDRRQEKHVHLYAPGIGLIVATTWVKQETRTGPFQMFRKTREETLIDAIQELLLPEHGLYWRAGDGAE